MVRVAPGMVRVVPSMLGVVPSMVRLVPGMLGVVPSMLGVVPSMVRLVPGMLGIVPSMLGVVPGMVRVVPGMLGIVPSMLGVVPGMVRVVPGMLGIVPSMAGVVPSMAGGTPRVVRGSNVSHGPQVPSVGTQAGVTEHVRSRGRGAHWSLGHSPAARSLSALSLPFWPRDRPPNRGSVAAQPPSEGGQTPSAAVPVPFQLVDPQITRAGGFLF